MASTKAVLDRLKQSWAVAWIAAIVLALTHLKDAVDGIERLQILVGLRPDALAIAESTERGAFARDFSETAWKRLFWARNVAGRIGDGLPAEEVKEAQLAYLQATEVWFTKMMMFVTYTERFHGPKKALELEQQVVMKMNEMSDHLRALRTVAKPDEQLVSAAHRSIDEANAACFHFVRGFSEKR